MSSTPVQRKVLFAPLRESPRSARRLVTEVLEGCGHGNWISRAELAVTELVTNVVLHAHTEMIVRVTCDDDCLRVEVEDFNPALPALRGYTPEASTGRGMALVAGVASDCGVTRTTEGKVVWFTISTGPDRADAESFATEDPSWLGTWVEDVTLLDFPPTLWLAAAQQHDALLRELALFRTGAGLPIEDVAAADRARSVVRAALDRELETARRTGRAQPPLPPGHPAELEAAPPAVDLHIPLRDASAEDFTALQVVLDEAQSLAREGELLAAPALPEILAVGTWVTAQIAADVLGKPTQPWPGVGAEHAVEENAEQPLDHDVDRVLADARMAIVVDDHNRIVGITDELAERLGWASRELVGRGVSALVPPTYREAHTAGFARHLATGRSRVLGVPLELPVLAKDGREVRFAFFIESERSRSDRPVYIAWVSPIPD